MLEQQLVLEVAFVTAARAGRFWLAIVQEYPLDSGRTASTVPAECMSCNWTFWMHLTKVSWAKVANLWLCVPRSNLLCMETGCVNGPGHSHCDKEMDVTTKDIQQQRHLAAEQGRAFASTIQMDTSCKVLQCLLRMKWVSGQIYPDAKSDQVKNGYCFRQVSAQEFSHLAIAYKPPTRKLTNRQSWRLLCLWFAAENWSVAHCGCCWKYICSFTVGNRDPQPSATSCKLNRS